MLTRTHFEVQKTRPSHSYQGNSKWQAELTERIFTLKRWPIIFFPCRQIKVFFPHTHTRTLHTLVSLNDSLTCFGLKCAHKHKTDTVPKHAWRAQTARSHSAPLHPPPPPQSVLFGTNHSTLVHLKLLRPTGALTTSIKMLTIPFHQGFSLWE